MAINSSDRIVPLGELNDFEVSEGDPDVRGWDVFSADGVKIGEVDELLIDTQAMKVRYLDVDVEMKALNNEDRHILIPIGYARLDESGDRVLCDQLQSTQIATLPSFEGQLTSEYETSIRDRFMAGTAAGTTTGIGTAGTDLYDHDLYDSNRFYGRSSEGEQRLSLSEEQLQVETQRQSAGEVSVNKTVESFHTERKVPVSHDEVVIERRPATGMSTAANISEDEVRIPLSREELITEKRVVPTEELVVRKQSVEEMETVEADLRRERAQIDTEGGARVRQGSNYTPSEDAMEARSNTNLPNRSSTTRTDGQNPLV